MLNHIDIMGRLTRDPECRVTDSGVTCCNFTVAVDRDFSPKGQDKETDFIDCVAWRSTAEFVVKYFQKGMMAVVSGRLQQRRWQDKEGNKRVTAEIVAGNVYFGEKKQSGTQPTQGFTPPPYPGTAQQSFGVIDEPDGNLPF